MEQNTYKTFSFQPLFLFVSSVVLSFPLFEDLKMNPV